MENGKSGKKLFTRVVAGVLAAVIIIVAAVQIVLSGKILTPIAMKYLPSMVDGQVHLGEISGSLVSSFPHLRVNVDDLVLTYPHDRFSRYDSLGIDGRLLHAGRGERVDTLAELKKLSLSINPFALLRGEYHLPMARFSGLRLYAHYYDSRRRTGTFSLSSLPIPQTPAAAACRPSLWTGSHSRTSPA